MSQLADLVHVDPAIISYVRRLAEASREVPDVRIGLSTRGCLAWIRAAKAWALSEGRGHVVPEDVATLAHPVLGHRLLMASGAAFGGTTSDEVIDDLLVQVPGASRPGVSDPAGTRVRRRPRRPRRAGSSACWRRCAC